MSQDFVVAKPRSNPRPQDQEAVNELAQELEELNNLDGQIATVTAEREDKAELLAPFDQKLEKLNQERAENEERVKSFAKKEWRRLLWHGRKTATTAFGTVTFKRSSKGDFDVIDKKKAVAAIRRRKLAKLLLREEPQILLQAMHANLEKTRSLPGVVYSEPKASVSVKTLTMEEAERRAKS